MRKNSVKSRNHTVGETRQTDSAQNVVIFPNVLSSDVYIDSDDRISGNVSNGIYSNKNNLLTAQVSRVGLKFVDMHFNIPNNNDRNNTYIMEFVGGSGPIPKTLPTRNYETANGLYIDIVNMIVGASVDAGLVGYTLTIIPDDDRLYQFTSSVGIKFLVCSGISFGTNLHGLSYTSGFVNEYKIIPNLFYTRYIDILVNEIIDAKVMSHKFSQSKRFNTSNHLSRLYIPFESKDITDPASIGKQKINFQRETVNINHYPFRHRDVSEFQISLVDEFQEPIYVGSQEITTTDPITTITSEIPYLKYNFVLSIIG